MTHAQFPVMQSGGFKVLTVKSQLHIDDESVKGISYWIWRSGGNAGSVIAMDVATAEGNVQGVPTHNGQYTQYNIFGNLFEVPVKYVPPIRPIGRGAYGIVWYVIMHFFLLYISPSLRGWKHCQGESLVALVSVISSLRISHLNGPSGSGSLSSK